MTLDYSSRRVLLGYRLNVSCWKDHPNADLQRRKSTEIQRFFVLFYGLCIVPVGAAGHQEAWYWANRYLSWHSSTKKVSGSSLQSSGKTLFLEFSCALSTTGRGEYGQPQCILHFWLKFDENKVLLVKQWPSYNAGYIDKSKIQKCPIAVWWFSWKWLDEPETPCTRSSVGPHFDFSKDATEQFLVDLITKLRCFMICVRLQLHPQPANWERGFFGPRRYKLPSNQKPGNASKKSRFFSRALVNLNGRPHSSKMPRMVGTARVFCIKQTKCWTANSWAHKVFIKI